uniref:GCS light chain n=1 Tax=Phallusia mammillata TaxID=59560 RepID=A0A6F9DH00_9ASCI|nr:uncharacterized protein LOC100178023 [Phallusia mammillata]
MDVQSRKKIIAESKSIVIYSGNVLFKVLANSEEICDSFCGTLERWIHSGEGLSHQQTSDQLYLSCEDNTLDSESSKDLKILLKVFLIEKKPEAVEHAVKNVIQELKCQKVDSVIVSLPDDKTTSKSFQKVPFTQVQDVWQVMENLVDQGLVEQLGICDFDADSLKDLYNNAKIKPVKNQINLANCCTPPDDLAAFAAENDIRLFTHNDPKNILPQQTSNAILSNLNNGGEWTALYIARYSSVVQLREIVKNKGYFLYLQKT